MSGENVPSAPSVPPVPPNAPAPPAPPVDSSRPDPSGSPAPHGEQPGSSGVRLLDAFEGLFGRFFRLAGSATLVTAVLVFAGFLSDFGAYRLAGLPRLNMTVTALVEQGADTLIDSIALLGGGIRAWVLGLSLLALVLAWGWRDSGWLQHWSRSLAVYRSLRIALLLLAVMLTGALFERSQRSLSGEQHGAQAIAQALWGVYDDGHFASTQERAMAIQEQTYMLRGLAAVNHLARWQARGDTSVDQVPGLALRPIAEARAAARHVYGWLVLLAVLLCLGLVLLLWWSQALALEQIHRDDNADCRPAEPGTPWLLRQLTWCINGLGHGANLPVERLLAPLSLLLAVVSLGLLPLAHGLLARPSLGAETVMVYLDAWAPERKGSHEETREPGKDQGTDAAIKTVIKAEDSARDLPESARPGPKARLDCQPDLDTELTAPLKDYRKARRDLLQERPTGEDYDKAMTNFAAKTEKLAHAVIAQNCAEAVAVFWAARPADGTRALHPALAETYFKSFRTVQAAYGVRVGTLLGYPRDGQGLTLANVVVPLPLPHGGRSSVIDIKREAIAESVVIPDLDGRDLGAAARHLFVDPDNVATAERLVLADKGSSLSFMANLLSSQRMHANVAGVTVTTLGTMALPAAYADPAAADQAIAMLIDLARRDATPWWPAKTDEIRGTAISSLHLAHLPAAANRFMALMLHEPVPPSGCANARAPVPAACLSTVPTAAGFLMQDLAVEIQTFGSTVGRDLPQALTRDRDGLFKLLFNIALQPGVADDVRGAACSAMTRGGKASAPSEDARRFSVQVFKQSADAYPISVNSCVQALTVLGLDQGLLRPGLRAIARGQIASTRPDRVYRLRATALVALADLDIAPEDELVFDLYLELASAEPANGLLMQRLDRVLRELMDDVAPDPLAKRLFQCGNDRQRPVPVRSHCLAGFSLLDDDYDGDDGHAQALYDLLASGQAPAGSGACKALMHLRGMGSSTLRRIPASDPVIQACSGSRTS